VRVALSRPRCVGPIAGRMIGQAEAAARAMDANVCRKYRYAVEQGCRQNDSPVAGFA